MTKHLQRATFEKDEKDLYNTKVDRSRFYALLNRGFVYTYRVKTVRNTNVVVSISEIK